MRHGLRRFESDLITGLKTEFPAAFIGHHTAIEELAIARHIALPVRLLDVTRNPQVALYWASGRCEASAPNTRMHGCERIEDLRDCACMRPHGSCDGRIHVFALPSELVRTFDSDRVSIVANFARLPMLQQERLLTRRHDRIEVDYVGPDELASELSSGSMEESMTTLLHNIRREKPYFTPGD